MDSSPPPDHSSVNRRAFFRQLMLRGLEKVEKTAGAVENKLEKWTQSPAEGGESEPKWDSPYEADAVEKDGDQAEPHVPLDQRFVKGGGGTKN